MLNDLIYDKIKLIKLIIFDVDGVLTSGKKAYDIQGKKIAKSFSDLDFTAIKILKSVGIEVIWLSGDQTVNEGLARIKNISFYCTRLVGGKFKDKDEFLPEIMIKYHLNKNNIWFIGDDVFDLKIIRKVGLSSCPADASFLVKKEVDFIHIKQSGQAIASEILELIFDVHKIKEVDIEALYGLQNLDSKNQLNHKD